MDIGPAELLIVLAVVLLVFGGSKVPQLARGLGQAMHEFRRGAHEPAADPPAVTPPGEAPGSGPVEGLA